MGKEEEEEEDNISKQEIILHKSFATKHSNFSFFSWIVNRTMDDREEEEEEEEEEASNSSLEPIVESVKTHYIS
ncbi:hypothetical protein M0804_012117 [Polistes exclamans]|nr:hypothetical protein M0804_012117 [Polistes exclamans]